MDFNGVAGMLKKHLLCDFLVVGGVSQKELFKEYYKNKNPHDIDIVFHPEKDYSGRPLLNSSVKDDFFVTYISPTIFKKYRGYYFQLVPKNLAKKIDLFMPQRDVRTQRVKINGEEYKTVTKEEIYLNDLRDFWKWYHTKFAFSGKYIKFIEFLKKQKIDRNILNDIWVGERPIVVQECPSGPNPPRKFNDYEEYVFDLIEKSKSFLVKEPDENRGLTYIGKQEGWGIFNEKKETYKKIQKMFGL